jgi:hypothetical protein
MNSCSKQRPCGAGVSRRTLHAALRGIGSRSGGSIVVREPPATKALRRPRRRRYLRGHPQRQVLQEPRRKGEAPLIQQFICCPAGSGIPTPLSGKGASANSCATSDATVTPASRGPTPSTATNLARGSIPNASSTPKLPLRNCRPQGVRSSFDNSFLLPTDPTH